MDATLEIHINFTKNVLIQKIIDNNEELKNQKLVKYDIKTTDELNGFMSNILFLQLFMKDQNEKETEYKMIIKLMKGTLEMKKMMKSDLQFANEIHIYRNVIPYFLKQFQKKFKTIDEKLWCAKTYLAEVGVYPELGELQETILVLEDLTPYNYKLGGRSHLSEAEMMLMTKAIAQFHACNYALKIQKDPVYEDLKNKIVPMRFKDPKGRCMYDVLYEVAFDRFFEYIDSCPEEIDSPELKENVELLRRKYAKDPLALMETFLYDDPTYTIILHGDYNRNNVLFRYDENSNPIDLRMIDFQENRYATPALDLTFFFYMNMNPELMKTNFYVELLQNYNKHLIAALCELLECKEDDERLEPYQYDNFLKYYNKFAFYGGMVCLHFLPWMTCPPEECEKLSQLWFSDMNSKEFYDLSMVCGGKATNERCVEVVRMATRLGHLDILKD